jgi:hypothetical protein
MAEVRPGDKWDKEYYYSKWGRIKILSLSNSNIWSIECQVVLRSAGVWSIVNREEVLPANGTEEEISEFERRITLALQIISNSVGTEFKMETLDYFETSDPAGLWAHLKGYDRTSDPVHISNLRTEFNDLKFDPSKGTILGIVSRMKEIRNDLIGTDRPLTEADLKERLLASLPIKDDAHWRNAHMLAVRANVGLIETINILTSYELSKDKEEKDTAKIVNSRGGRGEQGGSRGDHRGRGRGGYRGRGRGRRGRGYRGDRGRGRGRGGKNQENENWCYFCEKEGHWQADCRFYKKYKQIQMDKDREKEKEGESSKERAGVAYTPSTRDPVYDKSFLYFMGAQPATGKVLFDRALLSDSRTIATFLDSGATQHFSGVRSDFVSLKRWATPKMLTTANGEEVKSEGYGTAVIELKDSFVRFENVWFVEDFRNTRLISVRRLNEDNCGVYFENHQATVYDNTGRKWFTAIEDGLYYLDRAYKAEDQQSLERSKVGTTEEDEWDILHRRFGHVNYSDINKLLSHAEITGQGWIKVPDVKKLRPKGQTLCECCDAGKMKERYTRKTDTRATTVGHRLHADLSGIKGMSVRGFKYYFSVVDDATRATWVRFSKTKETTELFPIIKELQNLIERETRKKIAFFRADNGKGEFGKALQEELKSLGIKFEPSPPYEHWLNGVVERAIGIIDKIARTLLFEAKLPHNFWCYAVEHAVWLKNRLPTSALPYGDSPTAISPFEALYLKQPNLSKARVFGCKMTIHLSSVKHIGKYTENIKPGHWILIGMQGSSVYKALDLDTLEETTTTVANFNEYTFPAKELLNQVDGTPDIGKRRQKKVSGTPDQPAPGEAEHALIKALEKDLDTIVVDTSRSDQPQSSQNKGRTRATDRQKPDPRTVRLRKESQRHSQRLAESSRKTHFSETVVKMVKAMKAVHIDDSVEGESAPIDAPAAPFEFITVEQALREDKETWIQSIKEELLSAKNTQTYEILKGRPGKGKNIISSKFVLRKKYAPSGVISRHKSRLVIRGFEQKYGIDYFETFASVLRYNTLRAVLAKASAEDLDIEHIDVDTAFLNPTLNEEIYMEIPDFFELIHPGIKRESHYLKLKKALYGLKQAPKLWLDHVVDFFKSVGLRRANCDSNLFVGDGITILLYVDDMLIIGSKAKTAEYKQKIGDKWKIKDLGPAKMFLGFQIERNRSKRTLRLHHEFYVEKLLQRFSLQDANAKDLPAPAGTVLKRVEDNDYNFPSLEGDQAMLYRQIVGATLYLANCSRPDISYIVGQLARHMARPQSHHLRLAKHLLRYLKKSKSWGITYGRQEGNRDAKYSIWTDATFGTEEDLKSVQGVTVIWHGGAIIWSSTRQRATSKSSMEAEIRAASEGARDAAWMETLFEDLGLKINTKPILYSDNRSAVLVANGNTRRIYKSAKHIKVDAFFVKNDMVEAERLEVQHIPGEDEIADMLTKQLPFAQFNRFCYEFGLRDSNEWQSDEGPHESWE